MSMRQLLAVAANSISRCARKLLLLCVAPAAVIAIFGAAPAGAGTITLQKEVIYYGNFTGSSAYKGAVDAATQTCGLSGKSLHAIHWGSVVYGNPNTMDIDCIAGGVVTASSLYLTFACPEAWTDIGNFQCTLSSSALDPQKNLGRADCDKCDRTNPVNLGSGNKNHLETDYRGAGSFSLSLVRSYNSQWEPGAALSSENYRNFGANWRYNYLRELFAFTSSSGSSATLLRGDGRVIRFAPSGADWLPDSDVTDTLERLVDGSNVLIGWRLTGSDADEVELYDAHGRLISISNRAGLTQQLSYSDGAGGILYGSSGQSPLGYIAPACTGPSGWSSYTGSGSIYPGKLLCVTDAYGKQLNFQFDSSLRIRKMADPDGGIYEYDFDGASSVVVSGGAGNNLTKVTYPDARFRTYHYNEQAYTGSTNLPNALTGITDELGNRFSTYTYSSGSYGPQVLSTEHAGGVRKVTISYGGSFARTVTDALGGQRTYTMTPALGVAKNNGATGSACPQCGPSAATFDSNGFPATRKDWNSNRTDFTYNARGLQTQRVEALTSGGSSTSETRTITTDWHATWRLPARTAEPLRITTYVYNGDVVSGSPVTCGMKSDGVTPVPGVLCSKSVQGTTDTDGSSGFSATTSGSPRAWSYTWNTNGQVLTVNGPRTDVTDVTTYTYYADNDSTVAKRGNVATITNALSQVTDITSYNLHGQPLTIVDPNGLTTTLAYDARQRLISRSVGGEVTGYTYDEAGQLTRVTLPDGSYLDYIYDAAHRLIQMVDNLGNRIVYTLDLLGNRTVEEVRDPSNNLIQTRSRVYSSLNRLYQEIGASSQTTQYAYDTQGNLTSIDGPLSGSGDTTANQYDALNRLKQVTDPNSGVTQYAYDGLDQLTQVTDPRSLATSYTVNGLGNVTQQVSPDTGTTASTHDAAGNLLTQTDAKNQVTTYVYDELNRVTSITFDDGSKQTYAYDQGTYGVGLLTQVKDLNPSTTVISQIDYVYNQKGRVTSETRTVNSVAYVTSYSYDSYGRLEGMTYPSGRTLSYTFDALGRVNQVNTTSPSGLGSVTQVVAQNIQYHPFGGVKGYTLGNGQVVAKGLDQDGRVSSYILGASTFTLAFDNASRITGISETGNPSNDNTYSYDLLDRLTQAILPANTLGYSYDAVGNRLTKSVGANSDSYTYGSTSNRIATLTPYSGSARTFTLDANGSTTDDDLNQYTYDTRGRLLTATTGVGVLTYQVNALGQRIRKTGSSGLSGDTVFVYDSGGRLIAESSPAGATTREYLYLNDLPLAVVAQ